MSDGNTEGRRSFVKKAAASLVVGGIAATGTAAAAKENELIVTAPGNGSGQFDIEVPDSGAVYKDKELLDRDNLEVTSHGTAIAHGYVGSGQDRILFDGDPGDVNPIDVPADIETEIRSL